MIDTHTVQDFYVDIDEPIPASGEWQYMPVPSPQVKWVHQSRRMAPRLFRTGGTGKRRDYIWVDKAPADIHLKVTVQRVWDLRPHKISVLSPKDVNIEAVDASGIVKADGNTYDVVLKTPHDGLHRIESHDGGDYTRFVWPEGMPVTIPSGMNTAGISSHFRGGWTLYCYVPKGTKVFEGPHATKA